MIRVLAFIALVAWLVLSFADPFLSQGVFYGNETWRIETHKLFAQLTLFVYAMGFVCFPIMPIRRALWSKKFIPLLVLRPLAWTVVVLGIYVAMLPKTATIFETTINYVMVKRGYIAQSKREQVLGVNNPYGLMGIIPFRSYQYVYRIDRAKS